MKRDTREKYDIVWNESNIENDIIDIINTINVLMKWHDDMKSDDDLKVLTIIAMIEMKWQHDDRCSIVTEEEEKNDNEENDSIDRENEINI